MSVRRSAFALELADALHQERLETVHAYDKHMRVDGVPKTSYAVGDALRLARQYRKCAYPCHWCGCYHLGRNRPSRWTF